MNVLIVDAHPIFRAGLKQLLDTLDVRSSTLEARDPDEVERRLAVLPELDLVLADLPISERKPMLRVSTIINSLPNVPVIIISAIESREYALEAINLGAQGFIPKSATRDEMVQGLRLVLDGSVYLSKRIWAHEPTAPQLPEPIDCIPSHVEEIAELTNRQRETLALLVQGTTNKEIAEKLGISHKTVRYYVSGILKALKVRNRTQAALIANRAMRDTPRGFSQMTPSA